MEIYQYILLIHILASFGIFTGWGMESSVIQRLSVMDNAGNLKEGLTTYSRASRLSMASMAVTLAAGIYLMVTAWGQQAWITAAMVTLLFLIAVGSYYSRKVLPLLKTMSQPGHQFFKPLYLSRVRLLYLSIRIKIASGSIIVALMVLKPATAGTIMLMAILACLLSLIIFLSVRKKKHNNPN